MVVWRDTRLDFRLEALSKSKTRTISTLLGPVCYKHIQLAPTSISFNMLQPTWTCSNLLIISQTCSNPLQHAPTCSNLLQPASTYFNMLQPASTCSNLLQHTLRALSTIVWMNSATKLLRAILVIYLIFVKKKLQII